MIKTLDLTSFEPFVLSEETMDREVIIQAAYTNSNYVYLSFGNQNLSTSDYHFQLKAGDAVIVSDLISHIYAIGGLAGQVLSKAYYQRNVNINRRVG